MTHLILNGQLRSETDPDAVANLKRKGWQDAPAMPSQDAFWQDGAWVVPQPATYSAEQWISQTLTPMQLIGLQRMEASILGAGKQLGPKMHAIRDWLETLLMASSLDPSPRSDWSPAPCSYEDAAGEAVGQ